MVATKKGENKVGELDYHEVQREGVKMFNARSWGEGFFSYQLDNFKSPSLQFLRC